MKVKWILQEVAHLFFPNCCVVCHTKLLPNEKGGCLNCLYKIPRTNNFKESNNSCEQLLAGRFPFERVASFSVYTKEGQLQPFIHELKYNHKPYIGELLGTLYGKDMLGSDFIDSIDLIVPVPLHPKKLLKRGYNQAEAIAKGLSKVTSKSVLINELIRVIDNPTQTKRTKAKRWDNVEGIFEVNDIKVFENKHVLLVDDIITTGSTIEACASAILKCEGVKISVATLGEAI